MSASKHIAPLLRSAINHHKGSVRPSRVTVLLSGRAFSASTQVRRIWQPSPARPQHIERNTQPRAFSLQCVRAESTRAARPLTDRPNELEEKPVPREEPAYEITFTCKPCLTRSRHRITKQGYHKGTVLITCPHCKNRHVISDHLRIFNDTSTTVEQILAQRGESVKKGHLGGNGDMEFWDDGSTSTRDDTQPKQDGEPTAIEGQKS